MDLGLILDSSSSIGRRIGNYQRMKDFSKNLVEQLNVSSDGTHVAVMIYSTKPQVMLTFDDLRGARQYIVEVSRTIDNLPFQGGNTYINRALLVAGQKMFSPANGMRTKATQVKITANEKR